MKKYLITIAILCFILPHFAHADIISNLLLHYTLDDNAANTTVTDSQGLSNGTASANTSVLHTTGTIGTGAFLFNGSTQYVNTNYIWSASDPNFTISLWMKSTGIGNYSMVSQSNGQPGLISLQMVSGGKIRGFIKDTSNNTLLPATTLTYNDGNWHHAVLTLSGTNSVVYVDGTSRATDSTGTFTGVMRSGGSAALLIASEWNPVTNGFPGTIDDVCIYNRALSAADVTQLFNSTVGCQASAPTTSFIPRMILFAKMILNGKMFIN